MSSNLKDLRQFVAAKESVSGQDLVRMLDAIEEYSMNIEKRMGHRIDSVDGSVKSIQGTLVKIGKQYPLPVEDIGRPEVGQD